MGLTDSPMIVEDLKDVRQRIFAKLQEPKLPHRRSVLIAFKHVDKAIRVLGGPKMERPSRAASAEQALQYNAQEPDAPQDTPSEVLADNAPAVTGPEKPTRKTRKA